MRISITPTLRISVLIFPSVIQIEVLLNGNDDGSAECVRSRGGAIWPKYSVVFSGASMTQIVRILRILRSRKQSARYRRGRISSSIPSGLVWAKWRRAHGSSSTLVFRRIRVASALPSVLSLASRRRYGGSTLDERERPHGTGTRLPGAHNYRARWHTTMRVSYEQFTMDCVSRYLSSSRRCVFLSLSLLISRLPSLSFAQFTWALSQAPTREGSNASAPSMKIAGGTLGPLSVTIFSPVFPRSKQAFLASFEPPREATLGFDVWIPWHRHRDDQSSNYGRNPHVSVRW